MLQQASPLIFSLKRVLILKSHRGYTNALIRYVFSSNDIYRVLIDYIIWRVLFKKFENIYILNRRFGKDLLS